MEVFTLVLLNIYGKIQPTIISKKLGVGICNPDKDWVEGIQDDLKKEILIHNHEIFSYEQSGLDVSWAKGRYNLENIVIQSGWQEDGKPDMQIIAEHLIEIQIADFNNSLLQMKNDHLDSPSCESQYSLKFLYFCCEVQSSKGAKMAIPNQIPFATYDSDTYRTTPLIINYLEAMLKPHPAYKATLTDYTIGGITSLKYMGKLIDDFLVENKDFWLLDYIINAIFENKEHNAYYIFKVMSLIEMLIINPKSNGKTAGKIEVKLAKFLSDSIPQTDKVMFSEIMRKLRNKIGHGDFEAVHKLLEQYRQSFMQNFWYDEFEYSIENWTYGNICMHLDEALREILWLMLSDRTKLVELQMS